jgi:hypothetical protein
VAVSPDRVLYSGKPIKAPSAFDYYAEPVAKQVRADIEALTKQDQTADEFVKSVDSIMRRLTASEGAENAGSFKFQSPEETLPLTHPEKDPIKFDPATFKGGTTSAPASSYKEAVTTGTNPYVRRSANAPDSQIPDNSNRQLMVQFASDLIYGAGKDVATGQDPVAGDYYDKLYSGTRKGYARLNDFWEIPQWMGFGAHLFPNADVYVVRDMAQAKKFIGEAGYDRVLMSALDVNKSLVNELVDGYKGKVDIGGYVDPKEITAAPNVKFHKDFQSLAKDAGVEYRNGVDYRHFAGSDVIPRLTMSTGCKHKCAFCSVEKNMVSTPTDVVMQQAEAIAELGPKLVYLNDKTFGQAENYRQLEQVNEIMQEKVPGFGGFIVQTTAGQMKQIDTAWLVRSGIRFVELGIETYNDPILKEMRKPATESVIDKAADKLREAGVAMIPNIIIGFPKETPETYQRTLDWLKKNQDNISHANIYNLAVYKEAELGKKLKLGDTEADFNENVLEKSWMTDPQTHRTFAGELYGLASSMLEGSPESTKFQPPANVKKISDLTELWEKTPRETPESLALGRLRGLSSQASKEDRAIIGNREQETRALGRLRKFAAPEAPENVREKKPLAAATVTAKSEGTEKKVMTRAERNSIKQALSTGKLSAQEWLESLETLGPGDVQSLTETAPTQVLQQAAELTGTPAKPGNARLNAISAVRRWLNEQRSQNEPSDATIRDFKSHFAAPKEVQEAIDDFVWSLWNRHGTDRGTSYPEVINVVAGSVPSKFAHESESAPENFRGFGWLTPEGKVVKVNGAYSHLQDLAAASPEFAKYYREVLSSLDGLDEKATKSHDAADETYDWHTYDDVPEDLHSTLQAGMVKGLQDQGWIRLGRSYDGKSLGAEGNADALRSHKKNLKDLALLGGLNDVKERDITDRGDRLSEFRRGTQFAAPKEGDKKNFKVKPATISKAWILPNGQPVQLGGKWHHDWLAENAKEATDRWWVPAAAIKSGDQQEMRVAALKNGFARVNLESNSGRITFELREEDLRKHKKSIADFVEANAGAIDNISVTLFNPAVSKVAKADSTAVFRLDDKDKVNNIPFVTQLQAPKAKEGELFAREETAKEEFPEPVPTAVLGKMTQAQKREQYPEAFVPKSDSTTIGLNVKESPLFKEAKDEAEAVKLFSDRLLELAKEYKDTPEFKAGAKWYEEVEPLLKKTYGKDARLMAELLAATSPQANPEVNFAYAHDALLSIRAGRFAKQLKKFEEGLQKVADGSWESYYQREVNAGKVVDPPQTPSGATFLAYWITKHNLQPRSPHGTKYGISSDAVLKVAARTWLRDNQGPKTDNFVKNMIGESDEATIDVWAARTMRWAGYEGRQERWRVLPKNDGGLADADFYFSQKAFRMAAEELGMKPSALQGALWFAEKHRWAKNGWSRLNLGSYAEEIRKNIPKIETRWRQRVEQAEQRAGAKKAKSAFQLEILPK